LVAAHRVVVRRQVMNRAALAARQSQRRFVAKILGAQQWMEITVSGKSLVIHLLGRCA
jgi:hypothetical protein